MLLIQMKIIELLNHINIQEKEMMNMKIVYKIKIYIFIFFYFKNKYLNLIIKI